MYTNLIRGIKELKHSYNIRLYRSVKFRIFSFVLFILTFARVTLLICDLIQTGFTSYFFGESNFLLREVIFPLGIRNIFYYVATVVLDVFFIFILFLCTFNNKIYVKENHILLFFPPRIFFRIYKNDIHSIEPININSVSKFERTISWNFSKDALYKIICYDTEFLICSKDTEGMQKLMVDINPRNNPRECDEKDFDPNKFTRSDKIILGILLIYVLSAIQNILNFW